jgi:hypothetical protein
VITQAPKKTVTVYPRNIELKNYELLKDFEYTDVVNSIDNLHKVLKKWI